MQSYQSTLACTTTDTAGVAAKPPSPSPFLKRPRLNLSLCLSLCLSACPSFKRARAAVWCNRVRISRKQPQWRHAASRRGRASCAAPRRRRRSGEAVTKAQQKARIFWGDAAWFPGLVGRARGVVAFAWLSSSFSRVAGLKRSRGGERE